MALTDAGYEVMMTALAKFTSLEAELEKIINSPGTKSDRARALFALGCDRSDVVELLGMNYSQAHSIYAKEFANGRAATVPARAGKKAAGDQWSPTHPANGSHPSRLNLRPAQVRVVTQDGHEVLRDLDGTHCTECDRDITYSLKCLAFVHTNSKKEPTKLEDRYGN